MKATKAILSMALAVFTYSLAAGADAPVCQGQGCGLGRGAGCGLTEAERAERQQLMQQYVASLREKRANGTATQEELAWLEQCEQRGGYCVTGTPRGPRGGFGAQGKKGQGFGGGQGLQRGWRHGANQGVCPLGQQGNQNAGQ